MTLGKQDIEARILRAAYEAFFVGGEGTEGTIQLRAIFGADEVTDAELQSTIMSLLGQGVMQGWGTGGEFKITPSGVLYSEEKGFVPGQTSESNRNARLQILEALIRWHDEHKEDLIIPRSEQETELYSHLPGGLPKSIGVHVISLASSMGTPQEQLTPHLSVLSELGYIVPFGPGVYLPTEMGRAAQKYRTIRALRPQQRGLEFQRLIARILKEQGWTQQEGVRTPGEEIDVIFYRGTDFYLVECKWVKNPIGASVVRELHGKLSNRSRVDGVLLSMSGFTNEATRQVEDYSGEKRILLFGPLDIEDVIYGKADVERLLSDKLRALVVKRRAVFR